MLPSQVRGKVTTNKQTWLSKDACMTRFYSLYNLVIEFFSGIDCQLAEAVKPLKNDIAYLADVFAFINEVNKKFQGKMITLIRCKSVITSFISEEKSQMVEFPYRLRVGWILPYRSIVCCWSLLWGGQGVGHGSEKMFLISTFLVVVLVITLLFLVMEVRHKQQFTFMPST